MSYQADHDRQVFLARSERVGMDSYRGVFDVRISGGPPPKWSERGKTSETYPTRDEAVAAADAAARRWIDSEADKS